MQETYGIDEKDILIRLRESDKEAFRFLYERYSRVIYGNILKLVHHEDVADDLLQDVFVKIWEHRAKINPELSFRAYLFTCSRHFVFNFKRRLKLEIETAIQLAIGYDDANDAITNLLQAKEAEALVERVVGKLPEQRQRIFRLCKLDGLSYQEVADALNISVSTVRDHMVKANKFIKERLTHEEGLSALLLVLWFVSTS